jgi:hypothetical protein
MWIVRPLGARSKLKDGIMLDDLPKARTADLERVFHSLCEEEELRRQDDRRAAARIPFVRPLRVIPRGSQGEVIEGFSRNISPLGLGVVSRDAFKLGDVARIEIHRFGQSPAVILAECRWCDRFGHNWNFSGWCFLSLLCD